MAFTLWMTGLPRSGKSTLTEMVWEELDRRGLKAEIFDGDVIRAHLADGLGFNKKDRDTNVRRVGFICSLLNKHGVICLAAMVSPYAQAREYNRRSIPNFIEVFCDCPLDVAEARDFKGLYAKARAGEIPNFTGISDPYEAPLNPELRVDTAGHCVTDSFREVMAYLEGKGLIPPRE